jgi:UPF0042 nucleotide-binding protein
VDTNRTRTIIVTGLNGSGKTTALRALEDLGYFPVDNLPVAMLAQLIGLCADGGISRIAVVCDARERMLTAHFEAALEGVREQGHDVEVLFLDAEDEVLVRRYKEVRRQHPLQQEGESIRDAVGRERDILSVLRNQASITVDTSSYNVHELRRRIKSTFDESSAEGMRVRVESFGFKHGVPAEADYVFDVRFLKNPYFELGLREQRGTDEGVASFIAKQADVPELLALITRLLTFVLPRAEADGRSMVTVAIGCTGGHHRSVAIAGWVGDSLKEHGFRVSSYHRDIAR